MKPELKITALNLDIQWSEKQRNCLAIEKQLAGARADIFLLPEMFATGFNMHPDEIADCDNDTLQWMLEYASKTKTAICGSVAVHDGNSFRNRMYFVTPGGRVDFYDKRHLFSYSGEDQVYAAGKKRVVVEYLGWRLLLQVCYDLRFPVFSRNTGDYDGILYVANWPDSRIDAWNILLKARAVENQSYVFGVNRMGTDANNLTYPESTAAFFADGEKCSDESEQLITAVWSAEKLTSFRKKFRFLADADVFKLL